MDPHLYFFIKGLIIGFAIAAPVGPIGVLCIRRTILNGVASGLASGTGAAAADGVYGAVAAFGLTAVSAFLQTYAALLQGIGGVFLLYLGLKTALQQPHKADQTGDSRGKKHNFKQIIADFASTFGLTLTNPATILSFMAIFAGIGLVSKAEKPDYGLSALMVAGVFAGSFLWWCILSGGIGFFRHKLDQKALRFTNILSGVIIGGFGGLVLGRLLAGFMP